MEGNTNNQYKRVSPRDLFNEAKLLKCLGHLALMIHDNKLQGITFSDSGQPFRVGLHDAGYLTATAGIQFEKDGQPIWLGTPYNSKSAYPLVFMVDYEEIQVFDESGAITDKLFEYANS